MPNKPYADVYLFEELPKISGSEILLGGFSSLLYEGVNSTSGRMSFLTVTDRGPNSEQEKHGKLAARRFGLANFQPRWVRFEIDAAKHTAHIVKEILLTDAQGKAISGLPNTDPATGQSDIDEIPLSVDGKRLQFNPAGLDPEGIVQDDSGNYWMVDEYRPSLLKFSGEGKLIKRFVPKGTSVKNSLGVYESLPASLSQRQMNRGFEGVAREGKNLFAFLQSPLQTSSKENFVAPIMEFNGETETFLNEYAYPFESADSDKIGDAVSIGNRRFLVIEQNSKTNHKSFHKVFEITLREPGEVVKKRLLVDLAKINLGHIEKFEGISVVDGNTIALINDNDFSFNHPSPTLLVLVHLKDPLF